MQLAEKIRQKEPALSAGRASRGKPSKGLYGGLEPRRLKIAIAGTRGVPARYSGFETCAEELGARLAQRGHDVTVYCRSQYINHSGSEYKGMKLVKIPTIKHKYLDSMVHTFISCLHAAVRRYDVVFMMIVGNAPVAIVPRLVGQKVVLNVDGLDWKREKWPQAAKRFIKWTEWVATKLPHEIVTDSRVVEQYYLNEYGAKSIYIPYGSDIAPLPPGPTLANFGLEPRKYFLFVGRLVPENCAHQLTQAFARLRFHDENRDIKCVIVGDAPYADDYIADLKANAGPNVVFTGYCFGEGYRELGSNAYAFIETSEVGGTHPALLEAMGMGNCVVVNGTMENRETIGNAGFSYLGETNETSVESLASVLQTLMDNPQLAQEYRDRALRRAHSEYTWKAVTDRYERLFLRISKPPKRIRAPRAVKVEG
jgi:glycosyltransferase involved in cell wall biosynthesis